MYAPNSRLVSNQRRKRAELGAYRNAARSKKGVVGRIGRKIPKAARPTASVPAAISKKRVTCFTCLRSQGRRAPRVGQDCTACSTSQGDGGTWCSGT